MEIDDMWDDDEDRVTALGELADGTREAMAAALRGAAQQDLCDGIRPGFDRERNVKDGAVKPNGAVSGGPSGPSDLTA